jgi:hypothetical protein
VSPFLLILSIFVFLFSVKNRKTKIERIKRKELTMVDLTLNRKTKIERIKRKGLTMVDLTLNRKTKLSV